MCISYSKIVSDESETVCNFKVRGTKIFVVVLKAAKIVRNDFIKIKFNYLLSVLNTK